MQRVSQGHPRGGILKKHYRWYEGARIDIESHKCTLLFECDDIAEDQEGNSDSALVEITFELGAPILSETMYITDAEREALSLEIEQTQIQHLVKSIRTNGIQGIPGKNFHPLNRKQYLAFVAKTK